MRGTFQLKFGNKDSDVLLSLTWIEGNETVVIPPPFWPTCDDELEQIALALFPKYKLQLIAFRGKVKRKKAERERYYKKLMPDVQTFEVASKSTPNKKYTISVINKGRGNRLHCSCPDYIWRRRKKGTHCTHIIDWVEGKKEYATEEFAIVEDGSSLTRIPSLWYKTKKTLRTGDIDEFLEEEFAKRITRESELCKRWVES